MSELRIFYHEDNKIKISKSLDILKKVDLKELIWIDLNDVADEIEDKLEEFLKIYIQEDEEIEEIEMSSRYMQTDDSIVANSNFFYSFSKSSSSSTSLLNTPTGFYTGFYLFILETTYNNFLIYSYSSRFTFQLFSWAFLSLPVDQPPFFEVLNFYKIFIGLVTVLKAKSVSKSLLKMVVVLGQEKASNLSDFAIPLLQRET